MAAYSPASVEALLEEVRGAAVRRLCAALDQDFEGLAVAARMARKQGIIDGKWCKKLVRLDDAFSFARRLSQQRTHNIFSDLECMIGGQAAVIPSVIAEASPVPTATMTSVEAAPVPTTAENAVKGDIQHDEHLGAVPSDPTRQVRLGCPTDRACYNCI